MDFKTGEVFIRPATAEDAAFLSWVLLESSRSSLPKGFYDVLFDEPAGGDEEMLSLMKELVLSNEESFARWDGFLIAQIDGAPAAAGCGFSPKEKTGDALWRAVVNSLKRREWSEEKLAKVERLWNELGVLWPELHGESEHWIIEYVAVVPAYRQRGVCSQLMLAVLDRGRARGFKRAQITPSAGNEASVKAYKKVGFQEYCTISSPIFDRLIPGTQGVLHMRMDL